MPRDTRYAVFERENMGKLNLEINRNLSRIQARLDQLERVGAKKIGPVHDFAVQGRQGLFHVTWRPISNADGYILLMATDTGMSNLVDRRELVGSQRVSEQIALGNSAITRSFQIFPVQGIILGYPSEIRTATSVAYGAGEGAPTNPPFNPSDPDKIGPPKFL